MRCVVKMTEKEELEEKQELEEEELEEEEGQEEEGQEEEEEPEETESEDEEAAGAKAKEELAKLKEEVSEAKEEKEPEPEVPTEERYFNITLTKARRFKPKYRSRKAIEIVQEHLKKHTKRQVKISGDLNRIIWENGNNPPKKVNLRVEMTPEKATAYPAKK